METNNKTPKTYTPDMLELNTCYEITINPDNSHQYLLAKGDRLELVYNYLYNYHLFKIKDHCNFKLYPEFSNPSSDNIKGITRMHYHGTINFTSVEGIYMWYLYIYNGLKQISSVKVDTITSKETWKNYCTKNKDIMSMLCKHARVPYIMTHTNKKQDRTDPYINELNNLNKLNKRTSKFN